MNAVATGLGDFSSRRRKHSTSSEENYEGSKRWKTWHYVLGPESGHDSEGEESIYSIQEKSTDYAKDTSDTSSKSSWSSVTTEMIEYEVISVSEFEDHATPFRDEDESTTSPEEIEFVAAPAGLADYDTSSKSSGIQVSDVEGSPYLSSGSCIQCHEKLELPYFRYCSVCFKVRKSFFPPRPLSRKKRTDKERETSSSGVGSSATTTDFSEEKLSLSESCPTEVGSSTSDSSGHLKKAEDDFCDACFLHKKNGGYVHGKIVHVYNCYRCATKIFKERGRCPICNVRVRQVVKVVSN